MLLVLHGKDKFRKQLFISKLKETNIDPGMESMNFVQIENPDLDSLAGIVATPGWGFSKKIILIKNLIYLEKASDDTDVEKLQQIFSAELSADENLIVVIDNDKVLKTIKAYKRISKLVELHDFNEFTAWDFDKAARWLCSLKHIDCEISANTAKYLVEKIGAEDSSTLYNELVRLATLNKQITEELIDKECHQKNDAFGFAETLAKKDIKKALMSFNSLLATKDIHLGTLSLIETIVTRYHKIKLALKDRLNDKDLAALLGINPGRLYYLKKDSQQMQTLHLEDLLTKVLDTERNIKTGRVPLERAFRSLVLK